MAFGFFDRAKPSATAQDLPLQTQSLHLELGALAPGVDNVRHDVSLSPMAVELLRKHLAALIAKHGGVEDLTRKEPTGGVEVMPYRINRVGAAADNKPAAPELDVHQALLELQNAALQTARNAGDINLDLLLRLALIKLTRHELKQQHEQTLEICRAKLKGGETPRGFVSQRREALNERVLNFRISKRSVLRRTGEEMYSTLRGVEKEGVARLRRTLFGEQAEPGYELFHNRMLFGEDGRDDIFNAEHYVMLGNYEGDPDRFTELERTTLDFLREINAQPAEGSELEDLLNAPENAHVLFGENEPSPQQSSLLDLWVFTLEKHELLNHAMGAYEAAPLLAEYSPLINPQQIKHALFDDRELKRVEQLIAQHGKLNVDKLKASAKRMRKAGAQEKRRVAARYLFDFMRYHHDLRALEAVEAAMDRVNLIFDEKLRHLSAINNTLYEFLLPVEQKPAEDKVARHVILKADIRDSTSLTRTLNERGLNPASYFSLNFYDPINKLLPIYGAVKVFIEGDAVILAMLERENERAFAVARTCLLAQEMIGIVSAYNAQSMKAGLPVLELGLGVCYEDSAPLYLMDGQDRIMISRALNLSDRLSGCHKGVRQFVGARRLPFNVFCFQTISDEETQGNPDEFYMRYNIGGVNIGQAAFERLREEISLQEFVVRINMLWGPQETRFFSGLAPVGQGSYRPIVIREGPIPWINPGDFTVKSWTKRRYYELCLSPAVYQMIETLKQQAAQKRTR